MLTLNDIQQYLFGQNETISPDQEASVREKFASVMGPMKVVLRKWLRDTQSTELERVIYGNTTDTLLLTREQDFKYKVFLESLNSQKIAEKFVSLNSHHKFFPDDENAKKRYESYLRTLKVNHTFVEHTDDHIVADIELNAYKMLVLFYDPADNDPYKYFYTYMKRNSFLNRHSPVRAALNFTIPVNEPPLNLPFWRKLVLEKGRAIRLFQFGSACEDILIKQQESFDEIELHLAKRFFKRYNEYPALANLCMEHNINEVRFDKCLEIEKTRKKTDRMPDAMIDGSQFKRPGFFLVKMPIDDPHAYVLGDITLCCQTIGGVTEKCVIAGITREDCGFYVLLKGKGKSPYTAEHKIDYDNFQIVGQSYAWLSTHGNLVLDSWENLRPIDNPVVVDLLKPFCEEVVSSHDDIIRVTIGSGGRTPKDTFPVAVQPEKAPEQAAAQPGKTPVSVASGDALTQSLIYASTAKQNVVKTELFNILADLRKTFAWIPENADLEKILAVEKMIDRKFPQKVRQLFQDHRQAINTFHSTIVEGFSLPAEFTLQFTELLTINPGMVMKVIDPVYTDTLKAFLSTRLWKDLLSESSKSRFLSCFLMKPDKTSIIQRETKKLEAFFAAILNQKKYEKLISKFIDYLFEHPDVLLTRLDQLTQLFNKGLLAPHRLQAMLESHVDMQKQCDTYEALADASLLTDQNELNLRMGYYTTTSFVSELSQLQKKGALKKLSLETVLSNVRLIRAFKSFTIFTKVLEIPPELLEKIMTEHIDNADYLGYAISLLKQVGPLNATYEKVLLAYPELGQTFAHVFMNAEVRKMKPVCNPEITDKIRALLSKTDINLEHIDSFLQLFSRQDDAEHLLHMIELLSKYQLLTESTLLISPSVFGRTEPVSFEGDEGMTKFEYVLEKMHGSDMFTIDRCARLMSSHNMRLYAYDICRAYSENNSENNIPLAQAVDDIITYTEDIIANEHFGKTYVLLQHQGLLTQAVRNAIIAQAKNVRSMPGLIDALIENNLLTEENLLLTLKDPVESYGLVDMMRMYKDITGTDFNQEMVSKLLANPKFITLIMLLLGIILEKQMPPEILQTTNPMEMMKAIANFLPNFITLTLSTLPADAATFKNVLVTNNLTDAASFDKCWHLAQHFASVARLNIQPEKEKNISFEMMLDLYAFIIKLTGLINHSEMNAMLFTNLLNNIELFRSVTSLVEDLSHAVTLNEVIVQTILFNPEHASSLHTGVKKLIDHSTDGKLEMKDLYKLLLYPANASDIADEILLARAPALPSVVRFSMFEKPDAAVATTMMNPQEDVVASPAGP